MIPLVIAAAAVWFFPISARFRITQEPLPNLVQTANIEMQATSGISHMFSPQVAEV